MNTQTIKNQIKDFIVDSFLKKEFNPLTNHLIFADPRGGSTWLMEVIQSITKDPIVWEPLHLHKRNQTFNNLNFAWRQYIPENAQWSEAKEAFNNLFSGKLIDYELLQHASFKQIRNSERLLFKFCRGNALIPWLANEFDFYYKPIYMIRHPFSVVSSQIKHGKWNDSFSGFVFPNAPYNEVYLKHKEFLRTINSQEESLVALWCISNRATLSNKQNNKDWICINYEEFVLQPKKTMERIANEWNLKIDPSNIRFDKSSATTKSHSLADTKKRLSQWQNRFDEKQISKMMEVLEYFEITSYSKEVMPNIVYNYG